MAVLVSHRRHRRGASHLCIPFRFLLDNTNKILQKISVEDSDSKYSLRICTPCGYNIGCSQHWLKIPVPVPVCVCVCAAVQCSAVQCSAVQCSAMQCNAVRAVSQCVCLVSLPRCERGQEGSLLPREVSALLDAGSAVVVCIEDSPWTFQSTDLHRACQPIACGIGS